MLDIMLYDNTSSDESASESEDDRKVNWDPISIFETQMKQNVNSGSGMYKLGCIKLF